jgi:hypothetical protein
METDMKRFAIAIAASIVAATSFAAPGAEAGRLGFHFSPAFIPAPKYYDHGYRQPRHESRYERRQRIYETDRYSESRRRRAAIAKQKRLEAARERQAEERRQAAIEAAAQRRLVAKRNAERARVEASNAAASPPPPPTKKIAAASHAPVPTEALLTRQEVKSTPKTASAVASANEIEPATVTVDSVEAVEKPAELGCKKFLPGAGVTISVPCAD